MSSQNKPSKPASPGKETAQAGGASKPSQGSGKGQGQGQGQSQGQGQGQGQKK